MGIKFLAAGRWWSESSHWALVIGNWTLDIGHCLIQPPTIISPGIGHWGESVWLGNAGFSPSPYSLLCPATHCNPARPPHNEMAEQHFNALRHSFSPRAIHPFCHRSYIAPLSAGNGCRVRIDTCGWKLLRQTRDQVVFPKTCRGHSVGEELPARVLLIISIVGDLDRLLI